MGSIISDSQWRPSCRHTCESGSMTASDGLRPSVLARFVVSFDITDGDVGLRSFAASFLLLSGPMVVIISICGDPDCIFEPRGC